ncbi:hypothetical protein JWG41_18310 [Leptospira sp. 201903075]|uniref:hypothetical protein n=1 Tax=Leptospira chreensis TaxID=2810035 RepID=UPI001964BADF|nr:hypothetical protein [Leptospira chreensis]MBM9592402.1 hypothetical protein [Leptospira chreensis]
MNQIEQFHKAHSIILDGSKQASILVLAMIAGRGVWLLDSSNVNTQSFFYVFSFISVLCCVFTHLIYGFEFSYFLTKVNNRLNKIWLRLATGCLIIQILTLLLSIFFFVFPK